MHTDNNLDDSAVVVFSSSDEEDDRESQLCCYCKTWIKKNTCCYMCGTCRQKFETNCAVCDKSDEKDPTRCKYCRKSSVDVWYCLECETTTCLACKVLHMCPGAPKRGCADCSNLYVEKACFHCEKELCCHCIISHFCDNEEKSELATRTHFKGQHHDTAENFNQMCGRCGCCGTCEPDEECK